MLTPTPEQAAIIDRAKSSSDSIIINALAGAAKTTTLEMLCKALPSQPILSLAFNKKIATEMEKRLPSHVKAQTLNSLGHRVWGSACAKRLTLDSDKLYNITKELFDALPRGDRSDAWERYSEVRNTVREARISGYIPEGLYPSAKRLISASEFWDSGEEEPDEWLIETVDSILNKSIQLSYAGHIDFDDQIYMPTLFGGVWPQFPLVMVDEAQDLSAINHEMLRKLAKQRLIAVGDPYQSIYGFRGAVAEGMEKIKSHFGMTEMGLSISFRCPKAIVELARKRAPHMQWAEWAKEGTVSYAEAWTTKEVPDGSAIICRNNAPLFSCALRMLKNGRGVQVVGADIGPGLIKVLKLLGPETMSAADAHRAVDEWVTQRLAKTKKTAHAAVYDRADCLRVFVSAGPNLGAAIVYAESLFKSRGAVQLLSGHKSKGLEWDHVYHLDPWRIPSQYAFSDEEKTQERNIEYVITTRAKDSLTHVNLEELDNG